MNINDDLSTKSNTAKKSSRTPVTNTADKLSSRADVDVSKRLSYLENIVKDIHKYLKKDDNKNTTHRSVKSICSSRHSSTSREKEKERKVSFREYDSEHRERD